MTQSHVRAAGRIRAVSPGSAACDRTDDAAGTLCCFGGSRWGMFVPGMGLGSVGPAGEEESADENVGGSW